MSAYLSFPISLGYISSGLIPMGLIQDVILMVISGLACLYCVILNRRVKGLSNMKSGLGASIVTLTEAIRQTQNAAKDTEVTTLKAIHSLQNLMDEAESTISKLEARKIDLDRQVGRAAKLADLQSQLVQRIEVDLPNAISGANTTLTELKDTVSEIRDFDRKTAISATSKTTSSQKNQKTVSGSQDKAQASPTRTKASTKKTPRKTTAAKRTKPAARTKTAAIIQAKTQTKPQIKAPTQSQVKSQISAQNTAPVTPQSKSLAKSPTKKITPMKKSKSRDIVNLSSPAAASGSASNKKIA